MLDPFESTFPTKYWRQLKNGKVQCQLCPRGCCLKEGQRGLCFVRACHNSEIVLTTYGRSSGFCIDPIEKKPLSHFYPGTPVLSFGTAGCNLACKFCQNWDITKSRQIDTLTAHASPQAIANAARRHGCTSVAFTYNDPIVFHEYAIDVAQACREIGIKTVAVTSGFVNEKPREEFFRHMDAANVDLKSFTNKFYKELCAGFLQPILDTLVYLKHETDVWFEITNLLIPEKNDSEQELNDLTQWVIESLGPDVPIHFTAFRPDWEMINTLPTSSNKLSQARQIARNNGLRYAYTDNVYDIDGGSTYCHSCGTKLIGRNWFELSEWNLSENGACCECGELCAGRFKGPPGSWGSRRKPVQVNPGLS